MARIRAPYVSLTVLFSLVAPHDAASADPRRVVATAQASVARPALRDNAVFNNPMDRNPASSTGYLAIENYLFGLIDDAPKGATIRVTTWKYGSARYTTHLDAAYDRGVHVQVVADSVNTPVRDHAAFDRLQRHIGHDPYRASFVVTCRHDQGCVNTVRHGDHPIQHDKFMLFSATRGARNVVVQSSANMIDGPANLGTSGTDAWNNVVTLVDEPRIYDAYVTRFTAMATQHRPTARAVTTGADAKVYFFPETGHTMLDILHHIDCAARNTAGGWGAGHLTAVRVAMYELSDVAVAAALWRLDDRGCVVTVVRTDTAAHDNAAVAALERCDAHSEVTILSYHDKGAVASDPYGYVHSKYLLVDGAYGGAANQRLIWTGSYNYTVAARTGNDEALLELSGHPDIFAAYARNFAALEDHDDFESTNHRCPS